MFKKNLRFIFALFVAVFIFDSATRAQDELEPAANSKLTGVSLPASANRIAPGSVPAEITQTLEKVVASGDGKVRQGETEVLVWGGSGYKKASAATTIKRLTDSLKADGWKYEISGTDDGVTLFTTYKDETTRRALIGFHGATDDALVLAWTEVFAAGNQPSSGGNDSTDNNADSPLSVKSGGGRNDIAGIWRNGGMSMMADKNTVTGATTPSNASTFKYVFTADGRFEYVGLLNSTMYGCTTSLFNDKRGRYEISGSTLTLIPSKNFWRQQNSCAPNSTKERDYTLERETLQFRLKTDEYGATLICLTGAKSETCYRREKE